MENQLPPQKRRLLVMVQMLRHKLSYLKTEENWRD